MFQPYSLFVGLRYTRAKRRNHFISFISLVSIGGISLGATVLITVLSVMNGFEQELRARILGMTAHAQVTGYGDEMSDWQDARAQSLEHPEVLAAAPYISGEGMLRKGKYFSGVILRGVEPELEAQVSELGQRMVEGDLNDLQPTSFRIVLGYHLAETLGVQPGDKVDLMIPRASVTPAGVIPRFRRFTVSGVFNVDMYEYDRSVALVSRHDLALLYRMDDAVSGVRLKVNDLFAAPRIAHELNTTLQGDYLVSDWTRRHKNFFQAIATEKTVMFFILLLIIAVAAFNISSTMTMVVTDKQADIAILRTLGAGPRQIMQIFLVQGLLIGVIGTLLGVVGGVTLASNIDVILPWLEKLSGRELFDGQIYVISELRGEINWLDVAHTAIAALFLSIVFTVYPAWRASRVQPAEALRYE